MKKILFAVMCAVLFMSGCATWVKTNGKFVNPSQGYSVDLPWGWMMNKGKDLFVTRDGIWLENIFVGRRNIKEKLPNTKKQFVKGMLPEEVSGVILDEYSSNKQFGGLEVLENSPALIGGKESFKLVFTFTTGEGLKKKCIHYGFMNEDWVYEVSYTATVWNYFDKEISAFEELVKSFKFFG